MRALIWVSAIIIFTVLQVTIAPLFSYHGVKPDLLLILVTCSGMLFGKEKAVGIGFFSGLLQDLNLQSFFGMNILTKMMLGYVFGLTERKVFKESTLLPILAIFCASIFSVIVNVFFLLIYGYIVDILPAILNSILPFIIYNIILAVPIHRIVYKLGQLGKE